jgi:hypothetical protein
LKPNQQQPDPHPAEADSKADGEPISLEHPEAALTVLEADQLVAAKQRTRFGRRKLSISTRILLWGLRIYVLVMLIIVLVSVIRVLRASH